MINLEKQEELKKKTEELKSKYSEMLEEQDRETASECVS